MCVHPTKAPMPKGPGWESVDVPCRKCWACLKNKRNDLVAKVLMEHATSDWSYVLTLTYDDKKLDPRLDQAAELHTYDFKRFMARLRKKFQVRYLVAGEYGSRKGRCHFHVCLIGTGMPPRITLYKNKETFEPWPWGFTYAEEMHFRSIEYVVKYLTKKDDPKQFKSSDYRAEWVSYSSRPPLGLAFVLNLADRYVEERVLPRTFRINPPGTEDLNRRFQISGVSQHMFLERIFSQWPEAFDKPTTEWMMNAKRRFVRWTAEKNWNMLTSDERWEAIQYHIYPRRIPPRELTEDQYLWHDYQQDFGDLIAREKEAVSKWLARQEAEARIGANRRRDRRMIIGSQYGRKGH